MSCCVRAGCHACELWSALRCVTDWTEHFRCFLRISFASQSKTAMARNSTEVKTKPCASKDGLEGGLLLIHEKSCLLRQTSHSSPLRRPPSEPASAGHPKVRQPQCFALHPVGGSCLLAASGLAGPWEFSPVCVPVLKRLKLCVRTDLKSCRCIRAQGYRKGPGQPIQNASLCAAAVIAKRARSWLARGCLCHVL